MSSLLMSFVDSTKPDSKPIASLPRDFADPAQQTAMQRLNRPRRSAGDV